ncbi:MAG TPA: AtpZ/AtpI family protein [Candidatus Saccharimonadales bacterium]|nr:AtpZ/AtpI family protein [Candidatus Saccharimonadales bacterium]
MIRSAAQQPTPPSFRGESTHKPARSQRADFLVMALNMSWQLAIAVLVPVITGVYADKAAHTSNTFTFIGLALAFIGVGLVLWRTMQVANRLPVPKLTEAQKRAIKKSYEAEDDD